MWISFWGAGHTLGQVPVPQVMEPNPEYAKWSSFSAGTTATFSQATLDGSGVKVGNAVIVWTLNAVSAESVTISDDHTTQPGTPDEFTCSSGDVVIPAMIPVGSGTAGAGGRMETVVVGAVETIDVPAGTFQCSLTTTTVTVPMPGGQVCTIVTKEWTSDKVPGAMVKTTSTVDAGTGSISTAMELTAFSIK